MSSPFPGMDPYLESSWGDVHNRLITYIADEIQGRLPEGLRARMEERVYLEAPDEETSIYIPDVHVVEQPGARAAAVARVEPEQAAAEPLILVSQEPLTEAYIVITEARSGGRVVTAIEVISPSNKRPGPGRRLYLRKRREFRNGRTSTVEIDLLRGGRHLLPGDVWKLPRSRRTAYGVGVWRSWRRDVYEYYRAPLRERLPVIPIPLRRGERDLPLDLQPLIDRCYRNGGFDAIDYSDDPDPPLGPDDDAWADALLRERGRR
jgi:hypothetical protein